MGQRGETPPWCTISSRGSLTLAKHFLRRSAACNSIVHAFDTNLMTRKLTLEAMFVAAAAAFAEFPV